MSKELIPCPFCGGEDVERLPDGFGNWLVGCVTCDYRIQCVACTEEDAIRYWNTRPTEDALKYDLAQKKAALLVIAQWCDRGLKYGMRKHDMNEVFLWIRKLAKEEMVRNHDSDR